jgi:hypothetical protein
MRTPGMGRDGGAGAGTPARTRFDTDPDSRVRGLHRGPLAATRGHVCEDGRVHHAAVPHIWRIHRPFALLAIAIAANGFRRSERWAWWALLMAPSSSPLLSAQPRELTGRGVEGRPRRPRREPPAPLKSCAACRGRPVICGRHATLNEIPAGSQTPGWLLALSSGPARYPLEVRSCRVPERHLRPARRARGRRQTTLRPVHKVTRQCPARPPGGKGQPTGLLC